MNIREDIKAYIDGELSLERGEEVRKAIESDPALMEEYTAMKQMTSMIASLVRQPQVQGADKALQTARPKASNRFLQILVVTGVCAVLAAVLFPVFAKSKYAARKSMDAMEVGSDAPAASMSRNGLDLLNEEKSFDNEQRVESLDPSTGDATFGRQRGGANEGLAWDGGTTGGSSGGGGAAGAAPGRADSTLMPPADAKDRVNLPQETEELYQSNGRLLIKDATFTVEVPDVKKSVDEATKLAKSMRGYVESTSVSDGDGSTRTSAYVAIRVPQVRFEETVSQLRKYGEVKSENSSGEDVTAQVADIDARVRTLKTEEETLRTILGQAKKVGEVIEINDRISQVRQQIESYDAQRKTLSRLAALSTITLTFVEERKVDEEPVPTDWFDETKISAIVMLKGIGKFLAQAATFLFILSPVWVPVLLLALWIRRRSLAPAR